MDNEEISGRLTTWFATQIDGAEDVRISGLDRNDFGHSGRLTGTVHERVLPDDLAADGALIRQMCENMIDQLAAIHNLDLRWSGLDALGDGRTYLHDELDHWIGEIRRVQWGPLPALERLYELVREGQPAQCPTVTLVHGTRRRALSRSRAPR